MNSLTDVWGSVLQQMSQQLAPTTINTWFDEVDVVTMEDSAFVLHCSNAFKKSTIEARFMSHIKAALKDIFSSDLEVKILDDQQLSAYHGVAPDRPGSLLESDAFTFGTYVVGPQNKMAYAAARAVAEKPAESYNPLFIYGDSGLGKTHLLNAIWHEIQDNFPEKRILYVKAESFGNEFVIALQRHTTDDFHDKYRKNIDVLLVDDIQFLAGKESITEEFFHTFSALKDAGKQVVITSDRVPKDIPMITDRLKTRFESGLLADINPPEFETRCAVIKRKAEMLDFDIPQEVVEYIAKNVKNNIRHLESVTKKLQAMQNLFNQKPTIAGAQTVIKDIIEDSQPLPVTIQRVVDEVSRVTGISEEEIYSTKQQAAVTHARKITFYVIREVTGMSYVAIGKEFKKDHSTIMYNVNSIEKAMKKDSRLARQVNDIVNNINQHKDNQ